MTDAPNRRCLDELAANLWGLVSLPSSPDWDAARAAWNLAVDQRPAAVIAPRNTDDVVTVVDFANANGLQITAQVAGHGASDSLEGVLLMRMNAFSETSVDPQARVARVGAGVRWGDFLPALDGTGLIAMSGSNPNVSICGYSLGGGHSWFSRRHGFAAHSIRAVEFVDAKGTLRHVDAHNDPELLWALRGGGGDVGVVTALEIELYDAPGGLYGGKLLFDGTVAEQLLTLVAQIAPTSVPELSLAVGVLRFPNVEVVPPPLQGRVVAYLDSVFLGSAEDGAAALEPFAALGEPLLDTRSTFPVGALAEVANEPVLPSASRGWAGLASSITPELIGGMIDVVGPTGGTGATFSQLRVLGGALRTGDWDGGIAGGAEEDYLVYALWEGETETGTIDPSPITDHAIDRVVPTFLMPGETLARSYSTEALERLAAVKANVDPNNRFIGNRSMRRH